MNPPTLIQMAAGFLPQKREMECRRTWATRPVHVSTGTTSLSPSDQMLYEVLFAHASAARRYGKATSRLSAHLHSTFIVPTATTTSDNLDRQWTQR